MNRLSARKIRPALILIAVWFLQSCSLMQQSPRPHPLDNTFQTVQGAIAESGVLRRAMQADVVILAEKHDNRYHHGLQQKLLKVLLKLLWGLKLIFWYKNTLKNRVVLIYVV